MGKIIITGACGFVGSNTVKKFLSEGYEIIAIDNVGRIIDRLPDDKNLTFIQCNVSDIDSIESFVDNSEAFIHFAWASSSGIGRSDATIQTKNALDTLRCAEFAKKVGCKKFICAGSIMEHEVWKLLNEQRKPDNGNYIYGIAKYYAHGLCKAVTGIDIVWAHITNAYGVGEFSPRLINTSIRKLLSGEEIKMSASTQNYDFVYIDDVANAFYLLSQYGVDGHQYIIGSGKAQPLKNFMLELVYCVNKNGKISFGDTPGISLPIETFDITNLIEDTGFKPKVPFANGVMKTMEWILKQGDIKI